MPYKTFPEGGKVAVYKVDEKGQKVGKRLGLHPDKPSANKQLAALYASEKDTAKKEADEVIEEKALFSKPELAKGMYPDSDFKDDYGAMPDEMPMNGPMTMGQVQTMATSFADLMAQRDADEMAQVVGGLTDDFGCLAYNISCDPTITDKAAALAKLAQEFQDLVQEYAKHEDTEETVGGELEEHLYDADADKELAIARQIAGDNQPNKDKAKIGAASANNLPDSVLALILKHHLIMGSSAHEKVPPSVQNVCLPISAWI